MEDIGQTNTRGGSIVETVKSLIRDIDFPICHCVEAFNKTMYILNNCPHRILKVKTLEKDFIGEKPQVSQFVFGCYVYINVP